MNHNFKYSYSKRYGKYLKVASAAITLSIITIMVKQSRRSDFEALWLFSFAMAGIIIYHLVNWRNKYEFTLSDEGVEYIKNDIVKNNFIWDKIKKVECFKNAKFAWEYIKLIDEYNNSIYFDNYMGNIKEFKQIILEKVPSNKMVNVTGYPRNTKIMIFVALNAAVLYEPLFKEQGRPLWITLAILIFVNAATWIFVKYKEK